MPVSTEELLAAYIDCRKNKRQTCAAIEFESNMLSNIRQLKSDLKSGSYRIGQTRCFVVTRPRPREVWAGAFRDRIVHHLMYSRIAPAFTARFSADSSACIPGRGTLYGARRLERQVRQMTQNWSRPCHYLKMDLSNFFVSIHKPTLSDLLMPRIHDAWTAQLTRQILFHDPRPTADVRSSPQLMALVPKHKSLFHALPGCGLPIGNLSSQFFANVYMNELDQFVKRQLKPRAYARYVDDFVLLHEDPQWLKQAQPEIEAFLARRLRARLNPTKTILQTTDHGIDFVGHIIKPWRTVPRGKLRRSALIKLRTPDEDISASVTSYLGLMRASSGYESRASVCRAALKAGYSVDHQFKKIYPRST